MKILLGFSFCLVLFSSCSITKSTFSDASKWIPADFDMNSETLLVEEFPGKTKWNDDMKTFLAENYTGKYVVVPHATIADKYGKYSDLKKYRFAFQWTVETTYRSPTGRGDIDRYGRFYDRTQDKLYTTTKKINNYGNKAYMPFFNSIVQNAQKKDKSSSAMTKSKN